MSDSRKPGELERYREALEKIANFGHMYDCPGHAPVHECCCQPKDERDIAREALDAE